MRGRTRAERTSRRCQETQYHASILSDTFESCALGKGSLHSTRNLILTFTELHVHGDERGPMKDVKYLFPLANGSDVKYVSPRCHSSQVHQMSRGFLQQRKRAGDSPSLHGQELFPVSVLKLFVSFLFFLLSFGSMPADTLVPETSGIKRS